MTHTFRKLPFLVILFFALSQVCLGDQEVITETTMQCSSGQACMYEFGTLDLTKYSNINLEVELRGVISIPYDASIQLFYSSQNEAHVVNPISDLISYNRAFFSLNSTQLPNTHKLSFSYIGDFNKLSSSTFTISLKLYGVSASSPQGNLPCPFDCSDNNGTCNTFTGQCACTQGNLGLDCGIIGYDLSLIDGLDNYQTFTLAPLQMFTFYFTSSNTQYSKLNRFFNLKTNSNFDMSYFEYGGVFDYLLKSKNSLVSYMNSSKNIKYDMNEFPGQYSLVFKFINTYSGDNTLNLKFYMTADEGTAYLFDFSSTYGIIIITIVILITLVFALLVFLTTRYVLSQYKQKKLAQFQLQQKTLQIDTKIPNQKYSVVLSKYPNVKEMNECSICLDDFKEDSEVRLTPCFHLFHDECFNSFAHKGKGFSCPVCRRSLQDGEKDVFEYKLKMQASHTINNEAENKKSSQENEEKDSHLEKGDIENQIAPTALTSCNNIDENSNLNKSQAQQNEQQKVAEVTEAQQNNNEQHTDVQEIQLAN